MPDPAPAGSTRPPAYANLNSHWWDASQIYGSDRDDGRQAAHARSAASCGSSRPGLLPVDPETGVHFSGFTDNWWIGLAMLHTLFTLEHNSHLRSARARASATGTTISSIGKAKLINSALMAKIHTVEWTPAIVPHPVIKRAMNVNWSGLAGEDLQDVLEFLDDKELLGGIVGSQADHHAAPYSLTEEFVSVYRMHPLIPDDFAFHSLVDRRPARETRRCRKSPASRRRRSPSGSRCPICSTRSAPAIRARSRCTTIPRHLQNLQRDDGEHLDLAAVDILRDRERGVPRYNQFRRLLHKPTGEVVRRADRQRRVAQADQGRSTTTTSRRSI